MVPRHTVSRLHRNLLVGAASSAAVLIAMGGIVCSTNASGGCPDWPACHGRLVPPLQVSSILEYTHRALALLTMVLVAAAAVVGWKNKDSGPALRLLPLVAIALICVVAAFGAFAVLTGLPPPLAAVDLGLALVALSIVIAAAVVAWVRHAPPPSAAGPAPLVHPRLSLLVLASFYIVIVSGVLVAQGTVMRCVGGPLHLQGWNAIPDGSWQTLLRQGMAALAAVLAWSLVLVAVRRHDVDSGTRRWVVAFGVLFAAEMVLNASMVSAGPTAPLLIASVIASGGAWSALVVVTVRVHLVGREQAAAGVEAARAAM